MTSASPNSVNGYRKSLAIESSSVLRRPASGAPARFQSGFSWDSGGALCRHRARWVLRRVGDFSAWRLATALRTGGRVGTAQARPDATTRGAPESQIGASHQRLRAPDRSHNVNPTPRPRDDTRSR